MHDITPVVTLGALTTVEHTTKPFAQIDYVVTDAISTNDIRN